MDHMRDDHGPGEAGEVALAAWEERKAFVGFGEEDARLLRELGPLAQAWAHEVVEDLYRHLLANEATRAFFPDAATLERVQGLQRQYFLELTGGDYGPAYLASRLRIGRTHQRIGLSPRWYSAAYTLYVELVAPRLLASLAAEPQRARRTLLALLKLIGLDHELAMATYLAEAQRELQRSEELYRSILSNVEEVVYLVAGDPLHGALQYVSPQVTRIAGYQPQQLQADPGLWLRSVHPDDVPAVMAATHRMTETADGTTREYRFRHGATGEYLWFEDRVLPQVDATGRVTGMLGAARDVSERRQREAELVAVATVSRALRTAPTRAEMGAVLLEQVVALLGAQSAGLGLRDPETGETAIALATGDWAAMTGRRLAPGEGITGHVITTGEPYLTDDMATDPRTALPDVVGPANAATVPLIVQGDTIGALGVARRTPLAKPEVRILSAIADIAASALRRASLHEQTERRARHLAALHTIDLAISSSLDLRLTLSVLLDQVTDQLGVDAAAVLLLDPHTQALTYAAGRGFRGTAVTRTRLEPGQGFAGLALRERRIVAVPDLPAAGEGWVRPEFLAGEGLAAFYGVPLLAKGQALGVLGIYHRSPLAVDREWLDFLEALGGQAAIAIDSASLFGDLQRSNAELALAYDASLQGWARALELRDYETAGHSDRVTELTLRLGRALGMSEADLAHARRGARLHDIGKMAIPDAILLKPGPLTPEEWEIIRRHPAHAWEMLSTIPFLRPAAEIAHSHHEKWDGTGYPRGLQSEAIPLGARVFAVADVWDALLSARPYKRAWSPEEAREHIRSLSGSHFDPRVAEAFLAMEI